MQCDNIEQEHTNKQKNSIPIFKSFVEISRRSIKSHGEELLETIVNDQVKEAAIEERVKFEISLQNIIKEKQLT